MKTHFCDFRMRCALFLERITYICHIYIWDFFEGAPQTTNCMNNREPSKVDKANECVRSPHCTEYSEVRVFVHRGCWFRLSTESLQFTDRLQSVISPRNSLPIGAYWLLGYEPSQRGRDPNCRLAEVKRRQSYRSIGFWFYRTVLDLDHEGRVYNYVVSDTLEVHFLVYALTKWFAFHPLVATSNTQMSPPFNLHNTSVHFPAPLYLC